MTEYLPHGDQTYRRIRDCVDGIDECLQVLDIPRTPGSEQFLYDSLGNAGFRLPYGDATPWSREAPPSELLAVWGDEKGPFPDSWNEKAALKLSRRLYIAVGEL